MPSFTDQTGRVIQLQATPQRIVSLVPSQTELLAYLGLDQEVVGITKFCVHPQAWFRSKARVGGTKQVKPDIIGSLQPDLVIANKEENVKEQVEKLAEKYPVWISDVHDLDSAIEMIGSIGELTGTLPKAKSLTGKIEKGFTGLKKAEPGINTAYLVWKDPYMTVGGDTFISDIMKRAGFNNVFAQINRYPEIDLEKLRSAGCQLVLLSSEPYPFREIHVHELKNELPGVKVRLVDGEMFSWYGSRLLYVPDYLNGLISELR